MGIHVQVYVFIFSVYTFVCACTPVCLHIYCDSLPLSLPILWTRELMIISKLKLPLVWPIYKIPHMHMIVL